MMFDQKFQAKRRNTEFYTDNDKRKMFEMFKAGADVDEVAAEFPTRSRASVKNKMQRLGMTRKNTQ